MIHVGRSALLRTTQFLRSEAVTVGLLLSCAFFVF